MTYIPTVESKTIKIEVPLNESETILFRNLVDHMTSINMIESDWVTKWSTPICHQANKTLLWSGVDEQVGRSQMLDASAIFAFERGHILPTNYYCLDSAIATKAIILGIKAKGFKFVDDALSDDFSDTIQKALFGMIRFRV